MLVTPYNQALALNHLKNGSQASCAFTIIYTVAVVIIVATTAKSLSSCVSYLKTNTPYFLTPFTFFISLCLGAAYIYRKRAFPLLEKQNEIFEKAYISEEMATTIFDFIRNNFERLCPNDRFMCTAGAIHAVEDNDKTLRLIFISKEEIGKGSFNQVYYSVDWLSATIFAFSTTTDISKADHGFAIEQHVNQRKFKPQNVKAPSFGIVHYESQGEKRVGFFDKLYEGSLLDLYINHTGKQFTKHQLMSLTKQLLKGLSTLEHASVSHGDLTLRNVFFETIDGEYHYTIADFNVSRFYNDGMPSTNIPWGNPLIHAPEKHFVHHYSNRKPNHMFFLDYRMIHSFNKHDVWSMAFILNHFDTDTLKHLYSITYMEQHCERQLSSTPARDFEEFIDNGYRFFNVDFDQFNPTLTEIMRVMLQFDFTKRLKASEILPLLE